MSYMPNVWFWERWSSDFTQATSNLTILKAKIPCLDFLELRFLNMCHDTWIIMFF